MIVLEQFKNRESTLPKHRKVQTDLPKKELLFRFFEWNVGDYDPFLKKLEKGISPE